MTSRLFFRPATRKMGGFTLVELLVAIIVSAIGLLGLMNMQTLAVRWNHGAFLRSQAILQAHEMAERMYANPAGLAAGNYNNISGIPEDVPTCRTTSSETNIDCSASQLASFDLAEWNTTNALLLPSGAGTVSTPVNGVYTITLSWQEIESSGAATKTFSFEFKPLL